MKSIISQLIETGELWDAGMLFLWLVLIALYLLFWFKNFTIVSASTKTIISIFFIMALSQIFAMVHFLLKYAFSKDYSIVNGSPADMIMSLCWLTLAYGKFETIKKWFIGKYALASISIVITIIMIPFHLQGQGLDSPDYWYWGEYIFTFIAMLLSVLIGWHNLKYNWFTRFLYTTICTIFLMNILMFWGFLSEQMGIAPLNRFFISIADIMSFVITALILTTNIALVLHRNE